MNKISNSPSEKASLAMSAAQPTAGEDRGFTGSVWCIGCPVAKTRVAATCETYIMSSPVVGAIIPLLSVLVGAGLTYYVNVRSRQRTYVEDLFNAAITAVAVADASKHYLRKVARPREMSEDDHQMLLSAMARTAVENHTARVGEAREALARVVMYEPRVRDYYEDSEALIGRPNDVIELLVAARDLAVRTR